MVEKMREMDNKLQRFGNMGENLQDKLGNIETLLSNYVKG